MSMHTSFAFTIDEIENTDGFIRATNSCVNTSTIQLELKKLLLGNYQEDLRLCNIQAKSRVKLKSFSYGYNSLWWFDTVNVFYEKQFLSDIFFRENIINSLLRVFKNYKGFKIN